MHRIEHMTKAQEAELPAFRERWRAVGLSTAPIHADAARRAVRDLYRAGEAREPEAVIVLASPMACLLARAICERLVNEKLSDNQRAVLEKKLWDQLGDQLRDQLWDQLGDQLRGQLRDQLGDQLRGQLRDQLWDQLRDQLFQDSWLIGGQDAYWLAFVEFGERIGARFEKRAKLHFEAYKAYALTCGWLYPYGRVAFVSDRPEAIHFDAERRLHHDAGMAVRFRDGWGVHAWHGLRVPPAIIERQEFSAAEVEKQPNAEFRRVMLERSYGGRTGFDLYLEQRKAKLIAADELHGQPRRLLEVEVAGERLRVVEVVNGSLEPDGARRKFHLGAARRRGDRALPETPHEAIANSYGIHPAHYKEAVRT